MKKSGIFKKSDWQYFRDAGMAFHHKIPGEGYMKFKKIVEQSKIPMHKYRKRMNEMKVIDKFQIAIVRYFKDLGGIKNLEDQKEFQEACGQIIPKESKFVKSNLKELVELGITNLIDELESKHGHKRYSETHELVNTVRKMIQIHKGKDELQLRLLPKLKNIVNMKSIYLKSIQVSKSSMVSLKNDLRDYANFIKNLFGRGEYNTNVSFRRVFYNNYVDRMIGIFLSSKSFGSDLGCSYFCHEEKTEFVRSIFFDQEIEPVEKNQLSLFMEHFGLKVRQLNSNFLKKLEESGPITLGLAQSLFQLAKYYEDCFEKIAKRDLISGMIRKIVNAHYEKLVLDTDFMCIKDMMTKLGQCQELKFSEEFIQKNIVLISQKIDFLIDLLFLRRRAYPEGSNECFLHKDIEAMCLLFHELFKDFYKKSRNEEEDPKIKYFNYKFNHLVGVLKITVRNFADEIQDMSQFLSALRQEEWDKMISNYYALGWNLFNLDGYATLIAKLKEMSQAKLGKWEIMVEKMFFELIRSKKLVFLDDKVLLDLSGYRPNPRREKRDVTKEFKNRNLQYLFAFVGYMEDESLQLFACDLLVEKKRQLVGLFGLEIYSILLKKWPELVNKYPGLYIKSRLLTEPNIIKYQEKKRRERLGCCNSIFYQTGSLSNKLDYRVGGSRISKELKSFVKFENDIKTGIFGLKSTMRDKELGNMLEKVVSKLNSKFKIDLSKVVREPSYPVFEDPLNVVTGYQLVKIMDRGEFSKDVIGLVEIVKRNTLQPIVPGEEAEADVSLTGLFDGDSDSSVSQDNDSEPLACFESGDEDEVYDPAELEAGKKTRKLVYDHERPSSYEEHGQVYSLKILSLKNMRVLKSWNLLGLRFSVKGPEIFKISKNSDGSLTAYFYKNQPYEALKQFRLVGESFTVKETKLEMHPDILTYNYHEEFDLVTYGDTVCVVRKVSVVETSNGSNNKHQMLYISIYRQNPDNNTKPLTFVKHLRRNFLGADLIFFSLLSESLMMIIGKQKNMIILDFVKNQFEYIKSPFFSLEHSAIENIILDHQTKKLLMKIKGRKVVTILKKGKDAKEKEEEVKVWRYFYYEISHDMGKMFEMIEKSFGGLNSIKINHDEDFIPRVSKAVVNCNEEESPIQHLKGCFCCNDEFGSLDLIGIF